MSGRLAVFIARALGGLFSLSGILWLEVVVRLYERSEVGNFFVIALVSLMGMFIAEHSLRFLQRYVRE